MLINQLLHSLASSRKELSFTPTLKRTRLWLWLVAAVNLSLHHTYGKVNKDPKHG